MITAEHIVHRAKQASNRGDPAAALDELARLDFAALGPGQALPIIDSMIRLAHHLRRTEQGIALHRQALAFVEQEGMLSPDAITLKALKRALFYATGAQDAAAVRGLFRLWMGELPAFIDTFAFSPVADLRAWCKAHAIAVEALDPAQDLSVPAGDGRGTVVNYRCPETWTAVIPNAQIILGWDFVVAPTGEVLTGASYNGLETILPFLPHAHNGVLNTVAHPWPAQTLEIDADAFFLSVPERHHYGHWIADFLPRLRAWRGDGRKLVISAALPAKHRDLLARCGVAAEDLLELSVGQRARFRSLQVASMGGASMPSPENTRYLAKMLGPGGGRADGRGPRFFLVRDAGTRMPANSADVDALFAEFNVTKINPARLPLAAQQALLADAGAIIGAFGTELYCLYDLRPGASVIQLIWDPSFARIYAPQCLFAGLKNHAILCAQAETEARARDDVNRDLIVDCGRLREILTALDRS